MKTTTSKAIPFISPIGLRSLGAFILSCLALQVASAQDIELNGNYSVSESWSVTLQVGNGKTVVNKTYTGRETGTLAITNGGYTLINKTGIASLVKPAPERGISNPLPAPQTWHTGGLSLGRTIDFDGSNYEIDGAYPFSAEASGSGGFYAVIELTFFVITVPLGSDAGFSGVDPTSTSFTTTGTSADDLTGTGIYIDVNAALSPVTTNGYVNEVDVSSTASLASSDMYVVTVSASPADGGKVSGGGTFKDGASVVVTASPANGEIFANWTQDGTVVSTDAKYAFVVDSDADLTANFVASPFAAPAGVYSGLFLPDSGATPQNSGYFALTATVKGGFTGYLQIGTTHHSIGGLFDSSGAFSGNIQIPGQGTWAIALNLDLSGGNDITGTVGNGTWTAQLSGYKSVFNAKTNPASLAGLYTMVFAGTNGSTNLPGGNGVGTVKISQAGVVALAGSLADGSKITASATLAQNGDWPLYVPLYRGTGCLLGWVSLDGSGNISGNLLWMKPSGSSSYYPGGFLFPTTVSGGPYAGSEALSSFGFTQAVFSGGALAGEIVNQISIGSNNKVSNLSTNKLMVTFSPSTGLLTGSVANPSTPGSKPMPFTGVLLQSQTNAVGYFLDGGQSGAFVLQGP